MQETQVWFLGQEDPLEKWMATHSSILAWKIPWTEERAWQATYSPWGLKESDRNEQLTLFTFLRCFLYFYEKWKSLRRVQLSCVRLFATPTRVGGVGSPFLLQGSSQPRNRTRVFCIAGGFFTNWAMREVLIPLYSCIYKIKCTVFYIFNSENKLFLKKNWVRQNYCIFNRSALWNLLFVNVKPA